MKTLLSVFGITILALSAATAQEGGPPASKTKLEKFVAQDGVVIVRGFSAVGIVRAKFGGSIAVESKEYTNVAHGKKEYGITIEVKEVSRIERTHTSHIDYDEIDSLIKGLDYIAKIDLSPVVGPLLS